ncbi:hypothetical protein ACWV95_32860 [Streptomyces albus]
MLGEQTGERAADDAGQVREPDPDHGIETLIVFLGANNALSSVVDLKVVWSEAGYDDLRRKGRFTVWRPEHFAAELGQLAQAVERIRARHVIWCAVPHVTIAPIARGVDAKGAAGSRYFPYYTRPWISDRDFDRRRDPHLTGEQARAVDAAIDRTTTRWPTSCARHGAPDGTGTCWTRQDCWTGWPAAATSRTPRPGPAGGPPIRSPANCGPSTRCPTHGSC